MSQASVGFHCPECAAPRPRQAMTTLGRSGSGASQYRVTQVLMGLNLAAFIYSFAVGRSITSLSGQVLVDGGLFARAWVRDGGAVEWIGVAEGDYYRLVTSAFLHDGVFHLAFNLYILWMLGQLLEAGFGRMRFLSLYVVSMLGGSFGILLLSPDSVTVGASGAVFGLLGAMVLVQRAIGISIWRSGLGTLLIMNVVFTLLIPRVSIGGHFGGLAVGAAMGAVMLALERRRAPLWMTMSLSGILSLALVLGSVLAATQ